MTRRLELSIFAFSQKHTVEHQTSGCFLLIVANGSPYSTGCLQTSTKHTAVFWRIIFVYAVFYLRE